MLEPLGVSTAAVALAEIGDKTQLLALLLAAKYRKPAPILLGVLVATLLNHAIAAWAGSAMAELLSGRPFRLAVGAAFVVRAGWALIPDQADAEAPVRDRGSDQCGSDQSSYHHAEVKAARCRQAFKGAFIGRV